jgi:hypothetical protein
MIGVTLILAGGGDVGRAVQFRDVQHAHEDAVADLVRA